MQTIATIDRLPLAQHHSIAKPDKPAPSIPPRTRQAVRLMIEEGLTYQDAAARVGMHVRHMRKAIEKPHVLSYLRAQRQVFRAAICASNDLRLAKVRDTSGNAMAIVQAVKALEQMEDSPQSAAARGQVAGFIIQVINNAAPGSAHMGHVRSPDAKPLITLDSGSERDHETGK